MRAIGIGIATPFRGLHPGTSGGGPVPVPPPAWVPKLPSNNAVPIFAADFRTESTTQNYWSGLGLGATPAGLIAWLTVMGGAFSRAAPANYFQANVMKTAGIDVPRFPTNAAGVPTGIRMGYPNEIELCLWNRDLTNAVWTPTNMTVARSAGADGLAGTGSRLTATAANATILQSLTRASAARFSGTWIKRVTGSGVINMTQNGGTNWTAITVPATFQSLASIIPGAAAFANPVVGFQIVTSGDVIDVDMVSHREGSVSYNGVPNPIGTTTAIVQQAGDRMAFPYPGTIDGTATSLVYIQNNIHVGGLLAAMGPGEQNPPQSWLGPTDATHMGMYNGTAVLAVANATPIANFVKVMSSGNLTNRKICANAGAVAATATPLNNSLGYTSLVLGGSGVNAVMAGDLAFAAFWPGTFVPDSDLTALTT